MATVTVGVPVYNGADQLRECLECLLGQTLRDIQIRIYDNASTDATPDIAREFASRDSRITHIRHPENIRAMPNFHRVVLDCNTPHVMWRAHDDLCSPDYIDLLQRALLANPYASLAAPTTRTLKPGGKTKISVPLSYAGKSPLAMIRQLMFNAHAGWFYGLWKRDDLLREFEAAWEAFPHPWALDHLVLFPFLIDRAVAIEPNALFIQRLVDKSYTPKKGVKPPVAEMVMLRRKYWGHCLSNIEERPFSALQKLALKAMLPSYVGKRVYKLSEVVKRSVVRDKIPAGLGGEF